MKLSQLHPNEGQIAGVPSNPRQIKEDDFRKLKQSLLSFRSMMEARPIVVDEDFNILGGNMRYQALCRLVEEKAKIGAYEFGEEIPDEWVKQMPSWSEEQKREFVIKDNNEFGDWDWDMLANEWDADKLRDWGCAIPDDWGKEKEDRLPDELSGIDLTPDELKELHGSNKTEMERIIIVYKGEESEELAALLGITSIEKVVYRFDGENIC